MDSETSKWKVQYDYKTRNPRWAFEFITRDGSGTKDSSRKNTKFFTDNAIEVPGFKVRLFNSVSHGMMPLIVFSALRVVD